MTTLDNGAIITVRVEYDETFTTASGAERTERNSDAYWAVRTPQDGHFYVDDKQYTHPLSSYMLLGGQPIHIYDQNDIDGLHELLAAIELDMHEREESAS